VVLPLQEEILISQQELPELEEELQEFRRQLLVRDELLLLV
jgi:hypothetical protein